MLPMTDRSVVYDGLVAVKDGRIIFAGPAGDAADQYSAARTIHNPDAVLTPGLVDTHTHVGAHYFGTLCDEENVITALYDLWFPMEMRYDYETMYAGSCLGLWDALRGGVTTVANDQYFPEATAAAADRLGNRALVAREINEFSGDRTPAYDVAARRFEITFDRGRAEEALARNVELIHRWRDHPRVTPCLGPHAPDLLSGEMLERCAQTSAELDVKMLIHVAQSEAEVAEVRRRGAKGSIHYLNELGFLSSRVQAAHMVWLDDEEIEIAAASGMGMSWTPTIMMACHSYARIDDLIRSGLRIGFGTDCFSMDVLEELRYAIYSANFVRGGQSDFQLGAFDVLRMATAGGAECLGLAAEIGTIEEGKLADLVMIDMQDAQLVPNTNYFETLAYRAKSRNVAQTIVHGEVVYDNGELTRVDQRQLVEEGRRLAQRWVGSSRDVLRRTGVEKRIQPHFFAESWTGTEQNDARGATSI